MSTESRHILGVFEDAIRHLNSDIRRMGELAQTNLRHAVNGLLERNTDLCNRCIADEELVDELEKQIDREGIEIIMKFGPVAKDLRRVISTMKAAGSIERISDYAVALARRARSINQHSAVEETDEIRALYEMASAQLGDAIDSFCDGDLQAALKIQGRDADIDFAYRNFNKAVTAKMQQDTPHIPDYVDLLFCARSIERVGDQSCNIAEDAVYLLTARDIRHGGNGLEK